MKKTFSFMSLALAAFLAAPQAYASDSFREHRYDMFHALPVRSTDIVMMGNSITDMPNWPEFFAGINGRVINRGNSGGFSFEMRDNMECVLAGKPAKIFMKIGTNDLGGSRGTAQSIADNVRQCWERCKKESPTTEFYIESILPAYNQGIKTPATIAEANTLLKAIADEDANDKCYWVDLNSLFGGAVNYLPSNCTLDNLHLSAGGYKIWCDAIVGYMGEGASVVLPSNIATTQNKCGLNHPNGTRNTYFSGVPVTSDDILFIGDEMIKCGEWQELLGNDHIKNRGYGWGYGGSISVINTSLDAIFNGGTPKAVYLYTGTADLNNGASALATNKTAYQNLVKAIRNRAPQAAIVLMGNLPINNTSTNSGSIKPFNQWLAQLAASMDNVEYVDLYTPFQNGDVMNTDYVRQGTAAGENGYLYGLGYAKVAEILKPSLDKITGLDNDVLTEKEAKANIKNFTRNQAEAPAGALLTVENITITDAPYVVPAADAAPVLASNKGTVVIDYTLDSPKNSHMMLVGACNPENTKYFGIDLKENASAAGVRYVGLSNNAEGWYTRNATCTGTHKLVVVLDPEVGYTYYIDGTTFGNIPSGNLGEYGYANFSNEDASQLTLGGIITSAGAQLVTPCTIQKFRYYGEAMTATQVAQLDVEPVEESLITYTINKANGDLYHTNGSTNQSYNATWKSNAVPQLTISAGVNNMAWNNGNNIVVESGSAENSTYTIAAPMGYLVKDVTVTFNKGSKAVTVGFDGQSFSTGDAASRTCSATDILKRNFQFFISGSNAAGTYLTDFTVTIINEDDVEIETFDEPGVTTVFPTPYTGGVPYRIPAVATAKNGNLIVVADYRTSRADIGSGEIDLHVRLSADNGKNWNPIMKPSVMDGDGNISTPGYQYGAFGDPCIVADRTSDKVMIMSCSGYPGFFGGSRSQHQGLARWYSYDNGESWTEAPSFIDEEYIYSKLDNSSYGPITGMFVGSGKIHQSRYVKVGDYYRLYCSFSAHKAGSQNSANFVIYSDDFGQSWDFLGGVEGPAVANGGDEPKVDELPNGNVIFSGRRYGAGGRNMNIFQFSDINKAEGKWMGVAASTGAVGGMTNNNACNGEILIVPAIRKSDSTKGYLALQSVPLVDRTNVGIFWKFLADENSYDTPAHFAANWEGPHQASQTTSCYSTMSVQADKTIAFIYEENSNSGGTGYDIQYKNYSLDVLTEGKYTYNVDDDPVITVMPLNAMDVTPEAGTVDQISEFTVSFTKDITVLESTFEVADGITATASVKEEAPKKLVVTLLAPITEKGTYTLTVPAGVVSDVDEQVNKPYSVTYRILGEALPLGEEVTALADIDNHKAYALYNPHFTAYAIYAPQYNTTAVWTAGAIGDSGHVLSNSTYSEEANFADPNNAWMLVNYKDQYYLYNVGAEKFVEVKRPTSFTSDPKPIQVSKISGGFAFNTTGGVQDFMCASPQLTEPIAIWTNTDAGSCWQIFENPNAEDEYDKVIALIDPLTVGINSANAEVSASSIFDMQGRRLQAIPAKKGLYIINGNKVVK